MENKINIANLLKDCPKGMELDCTICDNVYFDEVTPNMIKCFIKNNNDVYNTIYFHNDGTYLTIQDAKCVIFPKSKTTWEGFQRLFKDGDVVFYNNTIAIFKEWGDETLFRTYCVFYTTVSNPTYQFEINRPLFGKGIRREARFATEEEKQKLFDAIKTNGYKWNPETKTLEKLIEPKFKVGDRIKYRCGEIVYRVVHITEDSYVLDNLCSIPISVEHMYNLVSNKFDITTLKPFDKVLVRCGNNAWHIQFFEKYDKRLNYPFVCMCYNKYRQCIPYDGNEHLLGTRDDCNEYYKTWE